MDSRSIIDYAMPMRVMGYDYGTYKKQYDDNAGKYKGDKRKCDVLSQKLYSRQGGDHDRFSR